MKIVRLKKEVEFSNENRFIKFIYDLLESRLSGDWNNYNEDDEVIYVWNLNEEEWIDIDFSWKSLSEFISEGICIVEEDNNLDLFYNVELKDEELKISFNYIDEDKF